MVAGADAGGTGRLHGIAGPQLLRPHPQIPDNPCMFYLLCVVATRTRDLPRHAHDFLAGHTRTADLCRVNLEFNHLQPFGSVAFPRLTTQKSGLKGPIFVDELLTSFPGGPRWVRFSALVSARAHCEYP